MKETPDKPAYPKVKHGPTSWPPASDPKKPKPARKIPKEKEKEK